MVVVDIDHFLTTVAQVAETTTSQHTELKTQSRDEEAKGVSVSRSLRKNVAQDPSQFCFRGILGFPWRSAFLSP